MFRTSSRGGSLRAFAVAALACAALLAVPPAPAFAQDSVVSSLRITSTPADGRSYVTGEDIVATVTFVGTLRVTEQPEFDIPRPAWKLRLQIGANLRTANWVFGSASGATGKFSYTVTDQDQDTDGVAIPEDALRLAPQRTNVRVGDIVGGKQPPLLTDPAKLAHAAVAADPAQKVRLPASVAVAPILSATAVGETRIDLSWTAPVNAGVTITGYKIEVSTDGGSSWSDLVADTQSTATEYSHTGLAPGSTRHYRVSAISGGTTGPASAVASDTTTKTPEVAGSAVESLRLESTPANGRFYVTNEEIVVAAQFIGNLTVTEAPSVNRPGWLVKLDIGGQERGAVWVHGSAAGAAGKFSYTVTDEDQDTDGVAIQANGLRLYPQTTAVRIRGFNDNLDLTDPNDLAHSAVPGGPDHRVRFWPAPDAPTNLAATVGAHTRINLSWTAPARVGGSPITGYRIEVSADAGSSWGDLVADTGSTATEYSHTGLAPASTRHYRVSAINAEETGPASAVRSATTAAFVPVAACTGALWSSVLTVGSDSSGVVKGYDSGGFFTKGGDLSDDDFSLGEMDYTVQQLYHHGSGNSYVLKLSAAVEEGRRDDLALRVGSGFQSGLDAADPAGGRFLWSDSGSFGPAIGDLVSVCLIETAAAQQQSTRVMSITAGTSPVTEGTAATFTLDVAPKPSATTTYFVTYTVSESGNMVAAGNKGTATTIEFTYGGDVECYVSSRSSATCAESVRVVSIPTVEDTTAESASDVTVTMTRVSRFGGAPNPNLAATPSATVTVRDDDGSLAVGVVVEVVDQVSGSDTVVTELAEDTGAATIRVTATTNRDEAPTGAISFSVVSVSGTADSHPGTGGDFTVVSEFLTYAVSDFTRVPAQQHYTATKTVTLTITDDTEPEPDETFELRTTRAPNTPAHVTLPGPLTITITDDDAPAQVTGVGVTAGAQQLTVSWTAVAGASGYKVQWKSPRQDFDASRQHVVTGGATTSYTIPNLDAGTEYTVQVIATSSSADGTASASVTGTPNGGVVNITAGSGVTEGTAAEFTLTADPLPLGSTTYTVMYTVSESGGDMLAAASEGSKTFKFHYDTVAGEYQTVSVGGTANVLSIPTVPDSEHEAASTVTVRVTGVTARRLPQSSNVPVTMSVGDPDSASLTVADDDEAGGDPVMSITPGTSPVTEGTAATFTLDIAPKPSSTTTYTVTYTVGESGDMVASTNEGTGKTIAFRWDSNGDALCYIPTNTGGCDDSTRVVSIPTVVDTTVESNSVVTVTMTLASGVPEGESAAAVSLAATASAMVTVEDDDDAPAQVTGVGVTAGAEQLTVSWTAVAGADGYKVQWKSGSLDFDASRQHVITGGTTTSTTIPNLYAGTEYTVQVIATESDADGTPSASVTGAPHGGVVNIAAGSGVTEGAAAVFTLTADPAPRGSTTYTVMYTVSESGGDMLAATEEGAKTFAFHYDANRSEYRESVGNTGRANVLRIPTVVDSEHEDASTVTVRLTGVTARRNPINENAAVTMGVGDPDSASLTVADDDSAGPAAPTNLAATAGDTEVALRWDTPASAADITGHEFRYKTTGDFPASWTPIADSAPGGANEDGFTLTGLTNGVVHTFEVHAVNSGGSSPASNQASATPIPVVSIERTVLSVDEGGGSVSVCAVVSNPSDSLITYTVSTADGAATAPDDYTALNAQGRLFPRQQKFCSTVEVTNDMDREGDEDFTATLSNLTNATLGSASTATITILASDPEVTIAPASTPISEENGPAEFTLTRTAPLAAELTVNVTVSQTGAFIKTADSYTAPTTVTFGATEATATLRVELDDDAVDEDDGAITATVAASTASDYAVGASAEAVVVVEDDDAEPALILSPVPPVGEDAGSVSFTVRLDAASGREVRVDYATADETAVSGTGNDYTAASGTLTFAAGDTEEMFTVAILEDQRVEEEEVFTVSLTNPVNATLAPQTVTVTITDNDEPVLTLHPVLPVGEDAGSVSFTVRLNAKTGREVTVDYATENETAVSGTGNDYTAASGTLTFAPGDTAKTFTVAILEDQRVEEDEVFLVRLTNPQNATVGSGPVTVTITDNDEAAFTVSVSPAAIVEAGGSSMVTVDTGGVTFATAQTITLTLTGTATEGTDYTISSKTLTLPMGQGSVTATVTARQDDVVDAAETVIVTASHDGNPVGSPATITITDDDTAGVRVSETALSVDEGRSATYTVRLNTQPTGQVTMAITGHAGTDLTVSPDSLTFTSSTWSAVQTVRVTAAGDDDGVADAVVTLVHDASGGGYGSVAAVNLPVTIVEDDEPGLVVSRTALTVREGETGTWTVALATEPAGPVTVAVTSGSAEVTVSPSPLTFTAADWDTAQTVTVTAEHDSDAATDPAVPVTHDASGGDYGSVADVTVPVTVTEDDTVSRSIALSLVPTAVPEGGGAASLVVTGMLNSAARADAVAVSLSVQAGTATETEDYAAGTATLTIEAGELSGTATLTLTPVPDTADEPDETVTVRATTTSGLALSPSTLTVTIEDDDDEPALALSPLTPTVGEDGGSVSFTATLGAVSGRRVTVRYATADGSAVSGSDYTAASGTLTFAAGDTAKTFTVGVRQDSLDEDAEDFTVTLSDPVNATMGAGTATVTITDDDAEPALALSPTAPSVEENAGSVSFTVRLDAASGREVTVDYATADGSAVSGTGNDYTAANGTLTFAAGDTTETFTVAILEDPRIEGSEDFTVRLTNPGNATLGASEATVTITDNDAASFTLAVSETAIAENAGTSTVTVGTGGVAFATNQEITLAFTGTATEGTDYTVSSKTLTLTAGQSAVETTITAVDDRVDDEGETIVVEARHGGSVVGSRRTITITDDDTAGVRVSETALSVDEGSSASYTVRLNTQPTGPVTVAISGQAGTDLTVSPDSLTFTSSTWSAVQTVRVTAAADDDGVADAVVTLRHAASGADYGSVAAVDLPVTIVEADEPGLVVSRPALTVREGETGTWTVALATEPAATVTVAVTSASAEVTVSPSPLTFTAADWDTAQTVTVTAEHDSDAATDPAVTVTHDASGGDYGAVADVTVPVTVTEDDTASTGVDLSVAPTAVPEGGGAASLVVTGMLNSAARVDAVEVSLSVRAGTATETEDYTAGTATLTIEAGETSGTATVTLTPVPDTADEPDETVTVRATTTSGLSLSPSSLTVTIEDDDDEPRLILSPVPPVAENAGSVSFTVRLDAVSGREVQVDYATTDGTAVSGNDYTAASGTLTFAAGETVKTFTVAIRTDGLDEDAEDFTVRLTNPVNATLELAAVTVTITDVNPEPALALSPTAPSVQEDAGSVQFTVSLSAVSGREVRVDYETADGSAVSGAGNDYTAANGTLTFAAGDTAKTFTVAILEDQRIEGNEDFTVALKDAVHAPVGTGTATVTITDNDAAAFTVTVSPAAIVEAGGSSTVTVDTGGVTFTIAQTITLALTGTATEGTDYTISSKTLTLPVGQRSVTATVTARQDDVVDADETVIVTASHGGSAIGTAQTITITDDDTAGVRVSETALSVDEGNSVSYTVRLNTQPTGQVTVTITGQAGTDLTVSPDSLTFTGSTWDRVQTVRVTAAGDDDGVADAVVTLVHAPSGADYGSVADVSLPVTIVEADAAGLVVSRTALTVREGETGTWTVALATEPTAPVTVAVTSASAEVTVSPASLRFTAADWKTAQTVTVTAEHDIDAVTDPAVTVTHDASGGDYGAVADVTVPVTVTEDDRVSTGVDLSVAPTAVTEGGGAASLVVTGMLNSAARADAVEVSLSVQAGTATETDDYTAGTATLTIEAGELSGTATVTLTPVPDTADEPDETVTVVAATTTSGLSLTPSSLTVTIEDDDDEPALALSPLTPTVGEDAGSVSFTATLGAVSGRRVTVQYATADGSAASGSDYTAAGGTLTFAAGDTAKTFTVGVRQDQLDEDAEDFTVTLSDPVNATVGAATATVTITDDDAEPALTLSPVTPSVGEDAGSVSFTVRLDAVSGREVTVDYATADGSAVSGTGNDYTAAGGTLTFAAGDTTETFTVAILEDQRVEGNEDFTVRLSAPVNATLGASEATVTITDNNAASFSLAVSPATIAEAAGTSTVTVGTGGIAFATDQEISLAFTGTATEGTDYTVSSKTLTLTAGQSAVETTITARDDRVDDEGETIVVEARHGGSAVGSRRTITITDDDEAAFTVAVVPARIAEAAGTSTVTVETGGVSFLTEQTITLSLSGTATEGTDYTVGSKTLTLAVGDTEVSTTVTAVQDRVDDDEETIVVEARHGGSVVGAAQTITITDDDEAEFTVSVSPAAIVEAGGSAMVTVDTGGVTFTTTQTITLALGGTATEGTDYTISSKSLRLGVGQGSVTATVTARQDDVVDIGETVVVTASHDGNTVGSPAQITITDDDTAGVRVSETALSVGEGSSVSYTVRLNTQPTGQVTMAITGHAGTDLTVSPDSLTFTSSNWSAAQTVRVTAAADDDGVANAVVTLRHAPSGADYGSVADVNLPVTIVEADEPGLVVSRPALTVREGETGTWTVALATEPTAPVTVAVTSASAEVTVSPASLRFTAADWEAAQTVTVTAEHDIDAATDPAVTVTHDASGGDYGAVADVTVPVTVTEDDTASTGVDLSLVPTAVPEGGGAASLVVTGMLNSAARADAVEVSLSVQAGTATATEDYTAGTATLTIEAGELSGTATVTLTPVPDTADEPDETVTVRATTTSGLSLSPSTLTVTIEDDDDEPALTLSPLTPTVGEDGGSVSFTATLGAASGRRVTVRYATADGSAVSGSDYTAAGGTLTFAAGDTAKTFTVAVRQDSLDEDAEDFTVTLSDPVNATLAASDATATVTITDDDTEPALALSPTAPSVGEDAGSVSFTVRLDAASGREVTVDYATADGSAVSGTGNDYTAANGTLTFAAGDTAETFTVAILEDQRIEGSEDFTVRLTNPGNATLGASEATVTITDNDAAAFTVAVSPATIAEAAGSSTVTVGTGGIAFATDQEITLAFTGTATEGTDYTVLSKTLTLTAGQSEVETTITATDDRVDDEGETIVVEARHGGSAVGSRRTITITDDDEAAFTVTVSPARIAEDAGTSTVTVDTGGISFTAEQRITLGFGGTATKGTDYTVLSETLTLAVGGTEVSTTVTAADDRVDDDEETIVVEARHGGSVVGAAQTITITDDDEAAFTVTVSPAAIGEAGGSSTVTVDTGGVTFTTAQTITLGLAGTATEGTDYTISSKSLRLAVGQRSVTATVTARQDDVVDIGETVVVTASHDGNTVGSPATITITDDDTAGVRVSETALSVDEGRSATYTVRLNTQPTGQVTMAITGHAGTELTVSPDSLTFTSSNWSAMQTVRVTAAADDDGVADAVVTLVHDASGGDYGSVADVNLPVTIVEDDAPGLVVSRAALTVREGETGTWTVALATEPTAPVTVAVTSASAEVTVSPSPLTFTAADWETAQTVTVTAEPDSDAAEDEAVAVTHDASGGDYGALADVTVPVTVTEDDTASTGVDLSVTPTAVTEDGGAVDLVVTGTLNSAARTDATEVSLSVQAGTATATEDYTAGTATLTIEAGELSGTATVTLTPVPDTADEPDETVTVVAATTTSGLSLSPSTLPVTIEDDDDEPTLALSPLTPTVGEGAGSVSFTATLGAASGRQVTVRYATADGSAVSGSDYTSRSGTLTFGVGETAKTFTVAVRQDRLGEDAEDFTVTLSDPVNATVGAATATVTITDDEALTVAVTARDATVTEGGAATFPVALSGGTGTAAVVVTYTVTGGTATAADYTAPSGTLTLEAGDTAGEITIQTTLDTVPDSGETLVVTLSGARTARGAVTVAGQPATTTIVDAGTVTVGVAPATVTEGGTLSFAVTLSGTVASDVTVGWTTRDGTGAAAAQAGADYTAVSGGTLTIAEGDRAGTLEVRTLQDTLAEDPETFTVTLTATDLPAGVTLAPATAAGTIIDDDGVTVGVAPAEATEGGTLSFAVTLSGQVSSAVVLGWTTADGTATADTDYMAVSGGTLTIAEGDRAGTLEVQTFQDTLAEEPETFTVTLTGTTLPAGVTLAPATATGTIIDDDGVARTEITVGVAPAEATEGGTLSFAVTLSGQVSSAVVLGWTTADGTATAGADYTAVSGGTLTIAEGDRAGTLEVQTLQDTLAEEPETFTVTISAGPGGLPPGVVLGRAMATGTIINAVPRNRPPVFTAARYTFDLPENRDGRVRAMALGTVAAPDPDGDAVTYGLAAGDRDRFAIDPGTGAFTYVGPGEDFEAGPTTYDLTVRASDAEGAEATASIVVTVTDGNEAPAAVGVIPDQALEEGGAPVTLDLAPFFDDVDGDRLTFAVVSSDPAAATAEVAGATLTLTAVVRGAATVTVTARDAEGSTATQVFGVTVGDRLARAATGDALAALGRGYLSSARLTIGRRLEAERPGTTQVTVAGQRVPVGVDEAAQMGQATAQRWLFGAAAAQQRLADDGPGGSAPTPGLLQRSAGALPFAGLAGGGPDRMLQGTDIVLAFGGGPAGGGPQGAGSPGPATGRRRWTIWGQGDIQTFRGESEAATYDGQLRTGYLGVDATLGDRWLAGVAVARSGGAAAWQTGTATGRLTTGLTTVHPYLRWAGRETTVWTLLGVGRGTASHVKELNGTRETTPLGLGLGLVEARRRLAAVAGGVQLGLRGEASWARLRTGTGDASVDALAVHVHRTRVGVEAARELAVGGVTVAPFGELSARRDGGAGQTGVGLELAAGVRVRGGRLQVEALGRRLVLHTAAGYEEQGASVSVNVGAGRQEPGLSLSLTPRWGAAASGADTLWQDQVYGQTAGAGRDDRTLEARVGYGVGLPGGRLLLVPFSAYGQSGSGRRVQAGATVGTRGGRFGGPVQIEFSSERYTRPGGGADLRVSLLGTVTFGGGTGERTRCEGQLGTPAGCAAAAPAPDQSGAASAIPAIP